MRAKVTKVERRRRGEEDRDKDGEERRRGEAVHDDREIHTFASGHERIRELPGSRVRGVVLTTDRPVTQVREVHGFALTAGDDCMAIAWRFCPMLIMTDPTRPIRMPMRTLHDSASLSSAALQQCEFEPT